MPYAIEPRGRRDVCVDIPCDMLACHGRVCVARGKEYIGDNVYSLKGERLFP